MRTKKTIVFTVAGVICFLLILTIANKNRQAEQQPPREQADEMLERIEDALETVDDEWEKQSVTEVIPITYIDKAGNPIVYYICKTPYYEADPAEATGLNINALTCVIDPETADTNYARVVNGMDAMLYEKEERSYLCWTVTPEYTLILEYSPESVTDADILKMAESVPTEEIK